MKEYIGGCHCEKVKFSVHSKTPYPFSQCYCSICRKLNGGGGYSINIMAETSSLKVEGENSITVYRSAFNDRGVYEEDGLGYSRRNFCKHCGTMLWNFNTKYPDWIYIFASAVDTQLPTLQKYAIQWSNISNLGSKFMMTTTSLTNTRMKALKNGTKIEAYIESLNQLM